MLNETNLDTAINGVVGGHFRSTDLSILKPVLDQLGVPFDWGRGNWVVWSPGGEEELVMQVVFPSAEAGAAFAHALPSHRELVQWYHLGAVEHARPGIPAKGGRRVVLIDRKPVTVWREVGVAAAAGFVPRVPLAGVYFSASDSELRWLPRDATEGPGIEELETMPPEQVAELWAQAQAGWPER